MKHILNLILLIFITYTSNAQLKAQLVHDVNMDKGAYANINCPIADFGHVFLNKVKKDLFLKVVDTNGEEILAEVIPSDYKYSIPIAIFHTSSYFFIYYHIGVEDSTKHELRRYNKADLSYNKYEIENSGSNIELKFATDQYIEWKRVNFGNTGVYGVHQMFFDNDKLRQKYTLREDYIKQPNKIWFLDEFESSVYKVSSETEGSYNLYKNDSLLFTFSYGTDTILSDFKISIINDDQFYLTLSFNDPKRHGEDLSERGFIIVNCINGKFTKRLINVENLAEEVNDRIDLPFESYEKLETQLVFEKNRSLYALIHFNNFDESVNSWYLNPYNIKGRALIKFDEYNDIEWIKEVVSHGSGFFMQPRRKVPTNKFLAMKTDDNAIIMAAPGNSRLWIYKTTEQENSPVKIRTYPFVLPKSGESVKMTKDVYLEEYHNKKVVLGQHVRLGGAGKRFSYLIYEYSVE